VSDRRNAANRKKRRRKESEGAREKRRERVSTLNQIHSSTEPLHSNSCKKNKSH
jgi:hypothetical protein